MEKKKQNMTKKKAHKLLDKARVDRLVPIKDINEALLILGDLDVRSIDEVAYEALRRNGDESCYVRTRSLPSLFISR